MRTQYIRMPDMLRRWYSHLLRIGTWKRKAFDRRGGKLARWRNLGISGNKADPVDGNEAKPQADLAEFTIGSGNLDFYDISNVVCPFELLPSKTLQFFQKIHNKHVHIYQSNWVLIFLLILPQIWT
jgi:hypothetical protein